MATFPTITGLVLRLRANAITGVTNGDPLATWTDASSSSNDATAAGAARPTYYSSGGPNGSARVVFDGSTDIMSCGNPASLQVTDFSIYAVGSVASAIGGNQRIMMHSAGSDSGANGRGIGLFLGSTTATTIKGSGDGSEEQVTLTRSPGGTGVYTWLEGLYSAASTIHIEELDTTSNSNTPDTSGVSYTNVTDFHIGGFDNGSVNYFDGDIIELVVYNKKLNGTEQGDMATYFNDEYFPDTITRDGNIQIDKQLGTKSYIAYLTDSTVTVQQFTTSSFAVVNSSTFGTCTVADWGNRVKFLQVFTPPFTWLSNCSDYVYAYGRWDSSGVKHLAKSTDAGATFTDIGDSGTWGADWISHMFAIDENTIYVFRAGTTKALYRTFDGGTTWSSALSTLPFDVAGASLGSDGRLAICSRTTSGDQVAIAESPLFTTWNNADSDIATTGKGSIVWL